MKNYFIKTPWWLKKVYASYVWSVETKGKIVYLTFDDGPNPHATPFVLDQLKRVGAKATFFCIGQNVIAEKPLYQRILDEGHSVGNHTHTHLNGWKTANKIYLTDAAEAGKYIDSDMFRPPYGRIGSFQARSLANALHKPAVRIIMWDVLSADFDEALTGEQCLQNILLNVTPGSIVVMHDSVKAFPRLEAFLPKLLDWLINNGWKMGKL